MCDFLGFKKRIFTGLLFLAISFYGTAQSDFRSWAGVKLKTEVFDGADFELTLEQRFDNNLTTFDRFIVEPGFAYSLNKHIKTGIEYRYYIKQDIKRNRESRHRFSGHARYKKEIDDFTIRAKTVMQYGIDDDADYLLDYRNKLINRNSLSLTYNIFGSKLTPGAEYEFFYHINHPNGGIINSWRIKVNFDYELSKRNALSLFYMFDKEINVAMPINAHIIGVEVEMELF